MTLSLKKLFSLFSIQSFHNKELVRKSILSAMYASKHGKSFDTIVCCLFSNINTLNKDGQNISLSSYFFPCYYQEAILNYPNVNNKLNTTSNNLIQQTKIINNEIDRKIINNEIININDNEINSFIDYIRCKTEEKCNEEFISSHIR